jgi:hypothetical protein
VVPLHGRDASGRKNLRLPTIPVVPPRLLVLALGAAVAAAAGLVAFRRRAGRGDAASNGGRERTEQLRREIEQARERLREDLARARGQE